MARQTKDVFGFEEFEKAIERAAKRYDEPANAFLVAAARQAAKRVRQKSPVGKHHRGKEKNRLKKGWGTQTTREYGGGKYKVARVIGGAPHSHLYELPHAIYTSPFKQGRKMSEMSESQKILNGVKFHGMSKGHYILRDTMKELEESVFKKGVNALFEDVIGDLEV